MCLYIHTLSHIIFLYSLICIDRKMYIYMWSSSYNTLHLYIHTYTYFHTPSFLYKSVSIHVYACIYGE